MGAHGAVASIELGEETTRAVLDDWRAAPVNEKVRVTLGFLEKLTLSPGDLTPDDVAPLRDASVSDEAIIDAVAVCSLFNIIDRIADALDFEVPSPKDFEASAKILLKRGYA